jgi:hypothetical protein
MHIHFVTPGNVFTASHARAKSEFLTLSNWDQPAKGDNPDRKH